ncbi:hypothetical protein R3P38DRAFT_2778621 [Favolaschia claudopus]|uniref:Uncharacterized protein n=1 Tax=Favolaschia claudopus TaxID=2862362 RepID=A0AAW0BGT8_9AGAR
MDNGRRKGRFCTEQILGSAAHLMPSLFYLATPGKSRGLPNKPGCQLELSVYFRHYLNCREKCWIVLSTITALKHELRSKLNLESGASAFFVRTAEDKAYPLAKSETPARYRNMPICASLNPKENLLLIRTLTARENIPYREWLYDYRFPNQVIMFLPLTQDSLMQRPLDFSDIVELYKRPPVHIRPSGLSSPPEIVFIMQVIMANTFLSFAAPNLVVRSQEVLAIGSDTGTLKIFDIGPARKKVVDIAFTSSITGVGLIVRQKLGRRRIGVLIDCANGDLETIIVPMDINGRI